MTVADLLSHATEFVFVPAGADPDHMDTRMFRVRVSRRGKDTWAITWLDECWNGTDWEYEPLPSSRDDVFLARCRFSLEEAVRIASSLPDTLEMNGRTYAGWEEQRRARQLAEGSRS